MKKCTVCKENKDFSEYFKSQKSKDGYGYRCKPCDKEARADYRENNRERFREVARRKQLKHKYGMSMDEYDALLKRQKGRCGICGTENPCGRKKVRKHLTNFAVDHCHSTGKIRGLLCSSCNRGLGLLGDNWAIIANLRRYLNNSMKRAH